MAKRGLLYPVFCPITAETGTAIPTYGTAVVNLKAISADINWTRNEAKLYANNVVAERDNAIVGGTISAGVDAVSKEMLIAACGVVAATSPATYREYLDKPGAPGGFGFIEVRQKDNVIKYISRWLYKVVFGIVEDASATQGETVEFQTPVLEGDIMAGFVGTDGYTRYMREDEHTTYALAKAAIDTLAGITA